MLVSIFIRECITIMQWTWQNLTSFCFQKKRRQCPEEAKMSTLSLCSKWHGWHLWHMSLVSCDLCGSWNAFHQMWVCHVIFVSCDICFTWYGCLVKCVLYELWIMWHMSHAYYVMVVSLVVFVNYHVSCLGWHNPCETWWALVRKTYWGVDELFEVTCVVCTYT